MALAVEEHGGPAGETIVLVHGFSQNARCWGPLLPALAAHRRVLAVDAPGHGDSPPHHDAAGFAEAAALLGQAGGRGTYVGYSMGGRLCLQLACTRPDLVERLVLIGATPGLPDAAARATRRAADSKLAARLLDIGLARFLDEWLALPLFAGLSPAAQARPERLRNRPEGLAASLRHCGTGNQEPLWEHLPSLPMAVLALAGAEDHKFAAIARRISELAPSSTVALVAGAGHTAHLEQPAAATELIVAWLDAHPAPG
ncbi:MAG: alpha/beta fold hydrolase [Acidimicrobiia bacterium]